MGAPMSSDLETLREQVKSTLEMLRKPANMENAVWLASSVVKAALLSNPNLTKHEALHNVFSDARQTLEKQNAEYSRILELRYWDGLTVGEAAEAIVTGERNFYNRQSKALESFESILVETEKNYRLIEQQKQREQTPLSDPSADILNPPRANESGEVTVLPTSNSYSRRAAPLKQPSLPRRSIIGIVLSALVLAVSGIMLVKVETSSSTTSTPVGNTGGSTSDAAQIRTVFSKYCTLATQYTAPRPPAPFGTEDFNIFTSDGTEGSLKTNNIRVVGENSFGVWVGYMASADKGIDGISYHYHDEKSQGHWVHCSGLNLLPNQVINDFAFTSDSVWVAIDARDENPHSPGVARLTKDGWQFYTTDNGLPSNMVYSLRADTDGTLWATTTAGVAKFNGTIWEPVYKVTDQTSNKGDGLPCGAVDQLFDDTQQTRWFGLVRCGVTYIINGQWHTAFNLLSDPRANVRSIEMDNQNGIWVGTAGGGLLRYDGQAWSTFLPPTILSTDVEDIKRDMYGRMWIATDKGVAYTSDFGKTWKPYSDLPTLKIAFGCDVCAYKPNQVWFVLRQQGLGYIRIPPLSPTIQIISTSSPAKIKPNEPYQFTVTVRVIAEQLTETKKQGDSLKIVSVQGPGKLKMVPQNGTPYDLVPQIGVASDAAVGQEYTFKNNDAILAETPGIYRLTLRVWQGKRFVTDPMFINFEVVPAEPPNF